MELKHLRYFKETAELEHITKAAERLMISQPFLTKHIKQLEHELGVELFYRAGRNIQLSEFGKVFYIHSQKILCELDNARSELNEMVEQQKHTITMITNVNLYMPNLLIEFHTRYPNLTLIHRTGTRNEIVMALQSGSADYALCVPPLEADPEGGVMTENLLLEEACVGFSHDHPLSARNTICSAELDKQNYVTSPKGYGMRDAMDRLFEEKGIRPNIVIETADISSVADYIKTGQCFTFVPKSMIVQNVDDKKRYITISDAIVTDYVAVSWNDTIYKTSAHEIFKDFIKKHFEAMGGGGGFD